MFGENVEKLEPSYTARGNLKWFSHIGKQCVSSSSGQTVLPYDPVVLPVGVYLRQVKTYVHTKTYKNMHSSSINIHNIQTAETTHMFIIW